MINSRIMCILMLRNTVCVYFMCVCVFVTWYFYYNVVRTKPYVNTELFALLIERYLVTDRFFLLELNGNSRIGTWQQTKCEKRSTFLFQEGDMDTEAAADIWVNRNRVHTRIDPLLSRAVDGCATKKMTSPRRLCPESKREFGNFRLFFPTICEDASNRWNFLPHPRFLSLDQILLTIGTDRFSNNWHIKYIVL